MRLETVLAGVWLFPDETIQARSKDGEPLRFYRFLSEPDDGPAKATVSVFAVASGFEGSLECCGPVDYLFAAIVAAQDVHRTVVVDQHLNNTQQVAFGG